LPLRVHNNYNSIIAIVKLAIIIDIIAIIDSRCHFDISYFINTDFTNTRLNFTATKEVLLLYCH